MDRQCSQCAAQIVDDTVVCVSCGASAEPIAGPALPFSPSAPTLSTTDHDLIGIGGWLILPAIGLVVAPILFLHGISVDLRLLAGSQYQSALISRPGLAGVLLYEALNNSVLLLSAIYLNILFYRRKRAFPALMMIYLASQFVLGLGDHLLVLHLGLPTEWTQVIRGFVQCAVWIPYFLNSRRVEFTFVN